MADLKVDYQLLASLHSTLSQLSAEFDNLRDQASSYNAAHGSEAVTAAMASFAGNWSDHRKRLLASMQDLDKLITTTATTFHQADNRLAADLTRKR